MAQRSKHFSVWFTEWLEQRAVTPARLAADQTRYDKYLKSRIGLTPVNRISAEDVEGVVQELLGADVGPFTVDATLGIIRGVLKYAQEQGAVRENVAWGIGVKDAPAINQIHRNDVLTDDQLGDLLAATSTHYRALLRLAAEYGLTWAECVGLTVDDFDVRERSLNVGAHVVVETSGHVEIHEGPGRKIYLDGNTVRELSEHILLTQDVRQAAGSNQLFLTPKGTFPFRTNFNVWVLRPALMAAGLDPRGWTFHSLRHTAARRMLERGVPLEQVSRALGHKSVVTTKRLYKAFDPTPTFK